MLRVFHVGLVATYAEVNPEGEDADSYTTQECRKVAGFDIGGEQAIVIAKADIPSHQTLDSDPDNGLADATEYELVSVITERVSHVCDVDVYDADTLADSR